ncbi:MAG: prepilin-type N-terminal cleavage/methylation domain-containing protein [Burkholderiaceae bacterium]
MPHSTTSASKAPQSRRGFTLIELMITIAIVAILSAVAIPAYSDYVRRGQLPEAFTNLSDYRVKMEQYFQDNRNYGAAACTDVAGAPTWAAWPSSKKYFNYTCALTNAGQGYTITATGSTARAVGHDYTMNQDNTQTTTKFKDAVVAKTCWLSRGDEC